MFLSENTAGLELFHGMKVRTWLVSLRDACITNSLPSEPDVVNSTHENREKFKFFNEFVNMCLAIYPTQKDLDDQNIFAVFLSAS